MSADEFSCVVKTPDLDDFLYFRALVGWGVINKETAEKSLKNSIYSVCVYDKKQLIGFGRIVGDAAMYYYIQDVIVLEEYRGKGIGRRILLALLEYINKTASQNAFVGLMAARGACGFYERLGFNKRPVEAPGMYRIVR